jgi:surface carbohydrate biosynthesis protein (TIGR04326 family)
MEVLISNSKKNIELNKNYDKIFIWSEYFESTTKIISIPEIIEEQSDFYKKKILDYFYSLSQIKINNINVIDLFYKNNEFNYWWLTSLGQKTNINENSEINNVLKIIVFNEITTDLKIKKLDLKINHKYLNYVFFQYCKENSIKTNIKIDYIFNFKKIKNIYLGILFAIKKLGFLLYNYNYYQNEKKLNGQVSFFDVFVHLKPDSITGNSFKSSYWNDLVYFINKQNFKTNWIHIFYPCVITPTYKEAKKIIKKFNCNGNHALIEDYITIKIYLKSIYNYIKNFLSYTNIFITLKKNMRYAKFNLSYLLEFDLHDSMFGITRFRNEFLIQIYDSILRDIPEQKLGFYIQENQFWEYILLSKWRKYKHGKIFGIPHSTIRYWDLRYFHSSYFFNNYNNLNDVLPDKLLINSIYSLNLLQDSGYSNESLKVVEALRYQHLYEAIKNKNNENKILIFGDFRSNINLKILSLISDYNSKYPNKFSFYFKQHPAFYFNFNFYNILIESDEIDNIWDKYSYYITSDISSTSAEVFTLGFLLLQYQDASSLNYSPLKGINDNNVFSNYQELENKLNNLNLFQNNETTYKEPFFILDQNLTIWKNLINTEFP